MQPSITGQASFNFPDILTGFNETITILYNVTTTAFVENNPILVSLEVIIPNPQFTLHVDLISIDVCPDNAVNYVSVYFSNPFPSPSEINLGMMYTDVFEQRWAGGQWVQFQAAGLLTLNIKINVNPTEEIWNRVNWDHFFSKYSPFTASVAIPSVSITSGEVFQQQTQQQNYENQNTSLTFFVLFFASVDIAVVLYDHSKRKDDQPNHE